MDVKSTLRPGQKGTKKLVARFGERLLYVRYRYDVKRRKRFTTVELIVDETDWNPAERGLYQKPNLQAPVGIRLELWESGLQRRVKAAGGRWDRKRGLWLLPREQVATLGLEDRLSGRGN
jgi:hypothetical protein